MVIFRRKKSLILLHFNTGESVALVDNEPSIRRRFKCESGTDFLMRFGAGPKCVDRDGLVRGGGYTRNW